MGFSKESKRWSIYDSSTNRTLAYTETSYPVGTKKWYFINESCTDAGMEYRTLNFHPFAEQPGKFCCHNGVCIDSELVCDGSTDCTKGEDEFACQMIERTKFYDKSKSPPRISVNIIILDLLTIDESKSSFELLFWLDIKVTGWETNQYQKVLVSCSDSICR